MRWRQTAESAWCTPCDAAPPRGHHRPRTVGHGQVVLPRPRAQFPGRDGPDDSARQRIIDLLDLARPAYLDIGLHGRLRDSSPRRPALPSRRAATSSAKLARWTSGLPERLPFRTTVRLSYQLLLLRRVDDDVCRAFANEIGPSSRPADGAHPRTRACRMLRSPPARTLAKSAVPSGPARLGRLARSTPKRLDGTTRKRRPSSSRQSASGRAPAQGLGASSARAGDRQPPSRAFGSAAKPRRD